MSDRIEMADTLLTGVDAADKPSASWTAVFEKIAAMLSDKWGIKVIMRGTEAHTDGKRIVLPVVPDNAPADLLAAVHGTLDHEAGHVIFSEFFAIPDALEKHLVNALEDAREEARLIAIWPGCAANLRACTDFFTKRLDEAGWPVSDFHKFCIALYFHERFHDDHWFVAKWIDECAAIQPHIRVAKEILARESVNGCATTRDVLTLARKILDAVRRLIEDERERAASDDPTTEDDDEAGENEGGDGEGGSTPSSDAEGADSTTTPGADGAPSGAAGGPDGDAAAGAATPAPSAASEPGTSDSPSATAAPGSALSPGSSPTATCADITAVTPAELRRDAEWTVQRFLSEKAREALVAARDSYLAYTTEHDVVEDAPDGDREAYQRMIRAAQAEVAAIKRTLARTLLASRKARWERGRSRGKINPAALHKIPVGVDRKVFRKREVAQAFNTRVSLLVDHSGSMMGGRIALAARAASAFAEVLAQLRIPFEVLGFTSGRHGDGNRRYSTAKPEDREIFARWGALRTIVYKEFNENFRRVSGRLHSMSSFTGGEANYDGESLLIAARRLAQASRPEERRILFVFSDGCPAGTVTHAPLWERQAGHLHEAIRQVRGTGTELFGIGIESDAVREYYPEYVVVNSAEDLPRETVRALDKLLRRGLLRQAP